MAKELRGVAGGIPIVVAPVPQLDAAFAEMTEMAVEAADPSYLDGGDIPEEVVAGSSARRSLSFRSRHGAPSRSTRSSASTSPS